MITNKMVKKVLFLLINLIVIANFIIPKYALPIAIAADPNDIEGIPDYDPSGTVSEDDLLGIINSILGSTEEEEKEEEGGALFTPISQFILGISDGVMATLQSAFIGDENFGNIISADSIKETAPGNNGREGVTTYRIKYSPAAIFSGQIPALDINFFNPLGDENGVTKFYKNKVEYQKISDNITYNECKRSYGASGTLQSIRDNMSMTELLAHGVALISVINAVEALANTDWGYATYGGGGEALTVRWGNNYESSFTSRLRINLYRDVFISSRSSRRSSISRQIKR